MIDKNEVLELAEFHSWNEDMSGNENQEICKYRMQGWMGRAALKEKQQADLIFAQEMVKKLQFQLDTVLQLAEKHQAKIDLDNRLICAMEIRLIYVCDALRNGQKIDPEMVIGWRAP